MRQYYQSVDLNYSNTDMLGSEEISLGVKKSVIDNSVTERGRYVND